MFFRLESSNLKLIENYRASLNLPPAEPLFPKFAEPSLLLMDDAALVVALNEDTPRWKLGLSVFQKNNAADLMKSIRDDVRQGSTYRVRRTLQLLGIRSVITKQELKYLLRSSHGSDVAFLWLLLEFKHGALSKETYSYDEQIIMTTISHLDMLPTLRELDKILPPGHKYPEDPRKRKRAISMEEKYQNVPKLVYARHNANSHLNNSLGANENHQTVSELQKYSIGDNNCGSKLDYEYDSTKSSIEYFQGTQKLLPCHFDYNIIFEFEDLNLYMSLKREEKNLKNVAKARAELIVPNNSKSTFKGVFYDYHDVILMNNLLRDALEYLTKNHKLVLPTLPEAYTVDVLRDFVYRRYGRKYTRKDRRTLYQVYMKTIRAAKLNWKDILIPSAYGLYSLNTYRCLSLAKRVAEKWKQDYHARVEKHITN